MRCRLTLLGSVQLASFTRWMSKSPGWSLVEFPSNFAEDCTKFACSSSSSESESSETFFLAADLLAQAGVNLPCENLPNEFLVRRVLRARSKVELRTACGGGHCSRPSKSLSRRRFAAVFGGGFAWSSQSWTPRRRCRRPPTQPFAQVLRSSPGHCR